LCGEPTLRDRYMKEQSPVDCYWTQVRHDQRHLLKKGIRIRCYAVPFGRDCVHMEEFTMGTDIYLSSGGFSKLTTECYKKRGCDIEYFVSDLFNGEVWRMYA